MRSSNLIRWGGLAAMLGGILGILIPPFFGVAHAATKAVPSRWRIPSRL
jgi:hypothetical protein